MTIVPATLAERLDDYLATIRTTVQDGVTLQEAGEILLATIRMCVVTASMIAGATGADKKRDVMAVVDHVIDLIMAAIPLPWWARWSKPVLKQVLVGLSDGMVEYVVKQL